MPSLNTNTIQNQFYTDDFTFFDHVSCLINDLENNYCLDDTQGEVDAYDGVRRCPILYICDRSKNPAYTDSPCIGVCQYEPGTIGYAKFEAGDRVVPICAAGKYDKDSASKIITDFLVEYWRPRYFAARNREQKNANI